MALVDSRLFRSNNEHQSTDGSSLLCKSQSVVSTASSVTPPTEEDFRRIGRLRKQVSFISAYSGASLKTVSHVDSDSSFDSTTTSDQERLLEELSDAEIVKLYADVSEEISNIQKENRLFQQFIELHADQNIMSKIEQKKQEVRRDMRRRRIYEPIKRAVSERLGLKKAANNKPRNLMEITMQAKSRKEESAFYETYYLDTWEKIDICLIALSSERILMQRDDKVSTREYMEAISRLDLVNFRLSELRELDKEFDRVCQKTYDAKLECYDADKIKFYFERQAKNRSSSLARETLLNSKYNNELKLKRMKERIKSKHLESVAERNKTLLLALNDSSRAETYQKQGLGFTLCGPNGDDLEDVVGDMEQSDRVGSKIQLWMVDKEAMELEKKKDLLAKLRAQSSTTGMRLADMTNQYQSVKSQLKQAQQQSKTLTEHIAKAIVAKESLDLETEVQQELLTELEKKNLELIEEYTKPVKRKSIHSQIMLNGEVFELRKQIKIWERKVTIKENEITHFSNKLNKTLDQYM